MKAVIAANSYTSALKTISALLGQDVDCVVIAESGKLYIESSNMEAWLKVHLAVAEDLEGEGRMPTKFEFLNAIRPNGNLTLTYEKGDDRINISMGRSRGAIRIMEEDEIAINDPGPEIKVLAKIPASLLIAATAATSFKPLVLDSSSPNAIIEVFKGSFNLSSYDIYLGTLYKAVNPDIKAKRDFRLTVEMDYWRRIVGCMSAGLTALIGADDKQFRVKTECFELYHALIDEDTQDVAEVIENLKNGEDRLAVIEFDGKDMVEAIDAAKGIIKAGSKEEARFKFTLTNDSAIILTESGVGVMESEIDIIGYDKEEEVNFVASSNCFSDLLKLTRDDNIKYGPVKLTVLPQYLVLESVKVPASSISPVLDD